MNIINYENLRKYKKKDFSRTFGHYKAFLKFLGSPQDYYKTIIITGSTGKGTTASLVSRILSSHGLTSGCYTSPHLVDVKERIMINNRSIPLKIFSQYEKYILSRIKIFNRRNHSSYIPTFFEILTIIALLYFRDKKVEYAVTEVGLGGRLDATNVSHPVLNFILPVCPEHTNFLGRSEKKILKEKQEVIKAGSVTVTLIKDKNLLKILEKKCKKLNSKLYCTGRDFHIKLDKVANDHIEFDHKEKTLKKRFRIPLTSCDVINNYGAVIFGLKQLIDLDMKKVYSLFAKLKFPGRFQVISRPPFKLILDGGHNLLAMQSLVKTIKLLKWKDLNIIFTLMSDKKADLILKELSKISKQIILTRIGNKREYPMDKLFTITQRYFKTIYLTKDIENALELVKSRTCIITGSFYLIGEFFMNNISLKKPQNKYKQFEIM